MIHESVSAETVARQPEIKFSVAVKESIILLLVM